MNCDERCKLMSLSPAKPGDCRVCPGQQGHPSQPTQKRLALLDDLVDSPDFTTAELLGFDEMEFAELKSGVRLADYKQANAITTLLVRYNVCPQPDCGRYLVKGGDYKFCCCGWEVRL